jgi:tryptophan synthase alpha chain
MNRIDKKFQELRFHKKKAFIAYICAGDPSMEMTAKLVMGFDKAGVDIIELGMPFSDPLADGPTIQKASQRALKNKVNIKGIFDLVTRLRKKTDIPIVLMGYYNPVYSYGVLNFIKHATQSGVDGVIIPDLAAEEAKEFVAISRQYDLSTIFLITPTSPDKRLKLLAYQSTGFIYYVPVTGVTGTRESMARGTRKHMQKIKKVTKKPVCIGFGVSTPAQAKALAGYADGVIIGSAIIKIIEKNLGNNGKVLSEAVFFAEKIVRCLS